MLKSLAGLSVLAAVLLAGCSSGAGTTSNTMIQAPLMPTVTLTAAAGSVAAGATTTLTWSSTDATSCSATGAWAGTKATSGSEATTAINADSTFTLSCTGTGGTAAKSATVTVAPAPTVTISASPSSVTSGGTSTVTWSSTNATSCTASGGWSGTQPTSGSMTTAALTSGTTYMLSCTGTGGTSANSTTVAVSAVAAPTVTLTASPSSITSGSSSTLTWSSTNATSCTASVGWSGSKGLSGSTSTGALTLTTNYTLTCTGAGGQSAATATVTVGGSTVTVSPRVAPLTLRQTQQFTASGGGTVNWSVDGVGGGNAAVGTINSSGMYVAPATAGTHTVTATSVANSSFSGSATAATTDLAGVYSYHNDLARSGQNLQEYALTRALVSGSNFGKRWACALDGDVYAQPLYVANLTVNSGTHNVVFVATNHDSVYAFDADSGSCTPLWMTSFLTGGATTIPANTYSCGDSLDEYGIVGTPVIDPVSRTLYAVAMTKEGSSYVQRLHALDISTGSEQINSPKVIAPTYPYSGGTRTFDAKMQLQRSGLVFYGGGVFVAWSSHCDDPTYYGWMARYDGTTLTQTAAFNVAPQHAQGGIWMSGAAPAVDSNGSIYLSTGNGSFTNTSGGLPATPPANDFSMSFLNFDPSTLTLNDFYTPSQQAAWSAGDFDISAPGVMVLPDGTGPTGHRNLLYGGDKQGHIWLLDRLQLGDYSSNSDNVVQMIDVVNLAATGNQVLYTPPAYFSGSVFASPVSRPVQSMALSGGVFSTKPNNVNPAIIEVVAQSMTAERCDFPGCGISISAAGSNQAIAWIIDNGKFGHTNIPTSMPLGPAVLRAYDATNLATRLFTSSASANDTSGNSLKFTIPMIANGRVYIGGTKQLTVYGIAP